MNRAPAVSRRRFLEGSLALGGTLLFAPRARAGTLHQVSGQLFVNGRPADPGALVEPGDELLTGPDARVTLSVGADAFLLRGLTYARLERGPDPSFVTGLRVLTGALMGVFGRGQPRTIRTPTVTAGIRGTGVYLEASPQLTYFCTCYGDVDLECLSSGARIAVRARDHTPHRIHAEVTTGRTIVQAQIRNHSNAELAELERLVGRESPLR